jgi:hypothetical protein
LAYGYIRGIIVPYANAFTSITTDKKMSVLFFITKDSLYTILKARGAV